ncbi:MAG TPA: hypothetical protein DEP20_02350 [Fusobacteria bacterium]|nr:hypothetical protein [Fusobacteriota bacterium]|tara:strand:+ start:9912 stop:11669 length:1758 start_codon:yes stop_codon:yes gene_type:complete
MIFLTLILSCGFKEFNVNKKSWWRNEASKAIQNPDIEGSEDILKNATSSGALHCVDDQGLLAIEEALRINNFDAAKMLMSIEDCKYQDEIYREVVLTKNRELFNLIPRDRLNYLLLSEVQNTKVKEIEEDFLRNIEATELERLIVNREISKLREKSKEWILSNYKDIRGSISHFGTRKRINTSEILCVYGEELLEEIVEKLNGSIEGLTQYLLYKASILGIESAVKYLLYKTPMEVDVNKIDEETGWTALMLASRSGHRKICELLLDKGVEVEVYTLGAGISALLLAAEGGHKEVCELLINKGAKIDSEKHTAWTPLINAATHRRKEVCELLIERGANIDFMTSVGSTALQSAAFFGNKEICKLLLDRGATINKLISYDREPLLLNMLENNSIGHLETIKLLVERGADVSAKTKEGLTPLMKAASKGKKEICKVLLDNGAKVDEVLKYRDTALTLAIKKLKFIIDKSFEASVIKIYEDTAKLLIERGANVNIKDSTGTTPLIFALQYCSERMCTILLKAGAEINSSELMCAAKNGYAEVCELILDREPKSDLEYKNGKAALKQAIDNGHKNVCEVLIKRWPKKEA